MDSNEYIIDDRMYESGGHMDQIRTMSDEEFEKYIDEQRAKEREVNFDDIPDGFDIESLPKDVEIIFKEDFPDLDDEFWEEDE